MDFKQFFQVVRRRWISIVVLVLLAVGISAFISFRMTPQYESTARVFITVDSRGNSDPYFESLTATGRVQSYADLADSSDLMEQVIADLDLELTPDELAEKISAEVVESTVLIEVTATDPDPQQAQAIARVESQRFSDFLAELETPEGANTAQIKGTITDPADLNTSPVSPRTPLNLAVALLIGLLVGVALAIAREILDRTVTTPEQVHELADAPVLASVAYDRDIKKSPLLTDLSGFAARTEAFRLLRTNLQFLDLDDHPRCLVITSAVPGEGKTMTSTNLALALAQTGRRTLLIDADLRRPRVAGLLGLDAAVGLTTVLVGKAEIPDAVQVHEPSGLHFLASGAKPPNPTEILQSQVTHDLIKALHDEYEMVIIDAPPLLPVADASVISTHADGTIMVIQHGKTTREQVSEAVTRLRQVGGKLSGVVVNMVRRRSANSYYYYYEESSTPAAKRR